MFETRLSWLSTASKAFITNISTKLESNVQCNRNYTVDFTLEDFKLEGMHSSLIFHPSEWIPYCWQRMHSRQHVFDQLLSGGWSMLELHMAFHPGWNQSVVYLARCSALSPYMTTIWSLHSCIAPLTFVLHFSAWFYIPTQMGYPI